VFGVVTREWVEYEDIITQPGSWVSEDACNCRRLKPCIPPVCIPAPPVAFFEQTEWCFEASVSGKFTWEAGWALRVLSGAGIEVEVVGAGRRCRQVGITRSVQVQNDQCFKRFARGHIIKTEATHFASYVTARSFWECVREGGLTVNVSTDCGPGVNSVAITTFGGWDVEHSQAPIECGGNADPPHRIVRRDEPCCQPLCNLPPGVEACCYCSNQP
jgi:hypothetical protein